ncbi:MAG: RecX family transcriptional regulator [Tannerellaceae bacterium]|jgi:regulatory protein|nr:RecX family transcriptional regulator [Tannerellaceae bacterium]
MKQQSESEMLYRMAAWCSLAERCTHDVQKKIANAGLSPDAQERIIARLLKEKFIDENRFASSFVNDKLRFNKWGRIKIAYELNKRKIAPDIRMEALERIDEQTYQTILLTLLKAKKKITKGTTDRDVFNKLLRFAAGRGFESKETISCLRLLFKGNDYEEENAGYEADFD